MTSHHLISVFRGFNCTVFYGATLLGEVTNLFLVYSDTLLILTQVSLKPTCLMPSKAFPCKDHSPYNKYLLYLFMKGIISSIYSIFFIQTGFHKYLIWLHMSLLYKLKSMFFCLQIEGYEIHTLPVCSSFAALRSLQHINFNISGT